MHGKFWEIWLGCFRSLKTKEHWSFTENQNPGLVYYTKNEKYNLPLPVLSLTRVGLLEKLLRTSRLRPNFSWMNSESSSHVTPLPSTDNAKDNWYSKWKKLKLFLFIFSLNTQGQRQWTERNEKCKMQKH